MKVNIYNWLNVIKIRLNPCKMRVNICNALRYLVPFLQSKKQKTLMEQCCYGFFSYFLNCTIGTQSRKMSYI